MFEGFDRSAIDFLWGIRLNNDKNWYESHKEEYRQNLAKPMKSLCDELFCDFYSEIGYETVSSVSRIVKDARFPHAYPYRDNYWFTFKETRKDWWIAPAFYFELSCEGWGYGMGMWSASAGSMQRLRNAIDSDPETFSGLVRAFDKQKIFTLEGDFYKRKKGEVSPLLDGWYNRKSISCTANFTYENETVFTNKLQPLILEGFRSLYPICRFIHNAINEE